MVYKETKIKCADNSGAFVLKTIHVFQRKQVQLGNFVQIVLNKFDTRKKLQKKKKYFGLLVTNHQLKNRQNGTIIKFDENRAILMADKQKHLGSMIYGPVCRELKKKLPEQQADKMRSISSGGFI